MKSFIIFVVTKYERDIQSTEDEMSDTFVSRECVETYKESFGQKLGGKVPLGGTWGRAEDNIKMDLK
jgi:hypothetical protein